MQMHENTARSFVVKGVDVGKLEKELGAMWRETTTAQGREDDGGEARSVTRACVLNLLVYTTEQEGRAKVDELLDEVTEQNPCRALILVVNREAEAAKLEAYVSSRCRMLGASTKQICGEQITFEAGGPVVNTVASAIAPLLVPDVPTFLWWKDIPHGEDKLFNQMTAMADRVVIDSATFDHPHRDLLRLAQVIGERAPTLRVSDLEWGRLTSWRTLIASFWDVAGYRFYLDRIDRVRIEYGRAEVAADEIPPATLLLTGWLAARLGWEIDPSELHGGAGGARLTVRAGGRAIGVELHRAEDKDAGEGHVASLTLSAPSAAGGRAEFYVALDADGTKLETAAKIGDERAVGRVLAYEARTEGQRLNRELALLARDAVYEQAVTAAARLIEAVNH